MEDFKYFDVSKFIGPEDLRLGNSFRGSKRASDPILESVSSSWGDMDAMAPPKKKKAKLQLVPSSGASAYSAYEPVSIPTDLFGLGEETGFDGKTNLSGKHNEFGLVFRHPCTSNADIQAIVKVAQTLLEAKKIKYFVVKREIGTKEEKLHLQAYVWFRQCQRYASVRKFFDMDPNLGVQERRARFRHRLRDYILKKETTDPAEGSGPFEVGTFHANEPGKRTDVDYLYEMLREGKTQRQIFEHSPAAWGRNRHALRAAEAFLPQPMLRSAPKIVVFYGETGVGKSRLAHELALKEAKNDTTQIYKYCLDNQFWERYSDQRIVLFDEFPGTSDYYDYRQLLTIIDRYAVQVNQKGASAWFQGTHIIFTSNISPALWYKSDPYNKGQLLRRLRDWGMVFHVTKSDDSAPITIDIHEKNLDELFEELLKVD